MAAVWVVTGALAAMLLAVLLGRAGPVRELRGWSLALLVAALIYVGFAAAAWLPDWLHVELAGLLLFAALALLGARRPWLLAVGWLLHVLWDMPVHDSLTATHVPDFYRWLCLGFDVVAAGVVAARFTLRRPRAPRGNG